MAKEKPCMSVAAHIQGTCELAIAVAIHFDRQRIRPYAAASNLIIKDIGRKSKPIR